MSYTQVERDAAWIIWQAGFQASGEGWNGEYPFERPPSREAEVKNRAYLYASFEEWYGGHCV